jgi:hypothetical protein
MGIHSEIKQIHSFGIHTRTAQENYFPNNYVNQSLTFYWKLEKNAYLQMIQ